MEAPRATQAGLLARLWPVLDPALDELPADALIEALVVALRDAFDAPASALVLADGERVGTGVDDPAWDLAPRFDLPVQIGIEEIGRLEIAVPDAAMNEEERTMLRLAAARIGRALARDRTEQAAYTSARDLRAEVYAVERLYAVAGALMAEHDLEQVVQYVTEEATALVGAQFGAFFYNVLDERGESYTLYTIAGVPRSAFERFPMPRNTQVFAPTFTGEGAVRSADITSDPRYGHNPPYHGMPPGHLPVRSYLAVPVAARDGEVLGGLFFGHPDFAVFDADDERLVVGIAALAALAIENARLHDTAQHELAASRRAYAERDQVARVLQDSLLPPRLPQVDGFDVASRYLPGEGDVGGDFYDLFPLAEGTLSAAIGDVQGKGAAAAARTSLVRHAVRLTAPRSVGPAATLQAVNAAVLAEQDHDDARFSTLLLARLIVRPGGGADVRVASGGHPPALLLRASGAVEAVEARGTLLGIVDDLEPTEVHVTLGRGDALVLYTDGLFESRRGGDMLGEPRLRMILADLAGADAEGIARGLEQALSEWTDERRRDDMALLVIRAA